MTLLLEGLGVEVDGTAILVGKTVLDALLDEGDDLRDVLRHARHRTGTFYSESGHIFEELSLPLSRERFRRDASLLRSYDDLVVDVRDVHDVDDVIPQDIPQDPPYNVELEVRTGVAQMSSVINRRTADVHRHALAGRINREEGHLAPRQRIVDVKLRRRLVARPAPAAEDGGGLFGEGGHGLS